MSQKITAIDLFCGAGGFTKAAREVGIDVLAAIELDNYACETYKNNFIESKKTNKPKLYQNDIMELDPNTILFDLDLKAGELDILLGGPPCQGFSTHRINNAGVNDPRNLLLTRYFDYVNVLKPKVFIVENVSGLLWPRHKEHLDRFYNLARRNGYSVYAPVLLDAKDYGVPQNRKRVFILGYRSNLNLEFSWPPAQTHYASNSIEVKEKGLPAHLNAEIVFEKVLSKDDPNNLHMNHTKELTEVFKSTPKNGGSRSQSCRVLPCHTNYAGHKDVYGRIDPKKPGPTMTTACINPSKGRFLHPTKNYGITVRHAARFQTFPDDFVFTGGLTATSKQIGNAVPVELGINVLKSLLLNLGE